MVQFCHPKCKDRGLQNLLPSLVGIVQLGRKTVILLNAIWGMVWDELGGSLGLFSRHLKTFGIHQVTLNSWPICQIPTIFGSRVCKLLAVDKIENFQAGIFSASSGMGERESQRIEKPSIFSNLRYTFHRQRTSRQKPMSVPRHDSYIPDNFLQIPSNVGIWFFKCSVKNCKYIRLSRI